LLSILSALNIATSESVTLLQIVLLALVTAAPPAFVTAATLVLLWRRYGGFTSHAVEARRTPVQHIPLAIGGSSPSRRPLAQVQLYGQAKALPPASIHANDNKVAGSALQPREGFAILLTFGAIVAALLLAARTLEPATETTSGFAVGPADSSLSSDGSMLRGDAGRTGVYPTKGVSEWPQIEWTFRSGSDWSQSPVAAGGIVLLPAGATVYAVDAKTGQEKWSHPYNGGTTSPSAIALGVAFFNSGCCLYAVDAYNGREKWKFDYGSGGSIDSPVVAGGVVYSNDSMGGRLHAIDATSGRELWALDTKGAIEGEIAVDESAAYFFRSPRMNDAVLSGEDDLYAVDLQSGKVKWKYHTGAGANVAAPTVADGLVYIRSARGSSGDEYLVALDTATGREVWAYTLPRWDSGTTAVVAAQGMVYFGIDGNIISDGSLVALDAKTGQEKWRNDRDPSVEWVDPVMAGGLLYISGFPSRADLDSMEARLHGIDAATGAEKWRVKIGGGNNRVPTLADDVIYLSDGVGNLYALR
jgi:outer membrane protein assembly factor BamB